MEPYKIEFNNNDINDMPEYIFTSYIKPIGIYTNKIEKKEYSITGATDFERTATVTFEINASQFMDPYSLYLNLNLCNMGQCPIKLDGSAHSLIRNITVRRKSDYKIIEEIQRYNHMMYVYFDLYLSRDERKKRHKNEGFGYNEYGSNETIIYNDTGIDKDIINEDEKKNIETLDIDDDFINTENIDMILNEKTYDIENDEQSIIDISEWNEANNGDLVPIKKEIEDINLDINNKKFKIPLYLKTIGHFINEDNYKMVPLKILGPILITIQFEPFACFIPYLIKKKKYVKFIETNDINYLMDDYMNDIKIEYILKNVYLEYNLYEFNKKVETKLYNQIKNNSWCIDYNGIQILNYYYLMNHPTTDISGYFKDKTQIRALYIGFLSDLYTKSPYSRQFARHNKGISRIIFEYKNSRKPDGINDINRNSLTTIGEDNGEYFWRELENTLTIKNSVLNKGNFFLNHSLSETTALYHYNTIKQLNLGIDFNKLYTYGNKEWLKKYFTRSKTHLLKKKLNKKLYYKKKNIYDFTGNIVEFQNKSLFTLNFDNMFNSKGRYRVGLKIKPEDKYKMIITRIDNYRFYDPFFELKDVFTYIYIYAEYYETIYLDGETCQYKTLDITSL
jgi:hypothetical protein